MIDRLTIYCYITKCQLRYLKHLKYVSNKNHLNETQNTCIVLADFSETYKMTVLDQIHSFYFIKPQCTILPSIGATPFKL